MGKQQGIQHSNNVSRFYSKNIKLSFRIQHLPEARVAFELGLPVDKSTVITTFLRFKGRHIENRLFAFKGKKE